MNRGSSPTTHAIITGAVAELAEVGQARFTMDGVARRAFYSAGAVYERWPDRGALLAEIAADPIATTIRDSLAPLDAGAAITWVIDDGRPQVELAGEILLAGHTMEAVAPAAAVVWDALVGGLHRTLPANMAWYVANYALGNALLDVLGMPGPTDTRGRIGWLLAACSADADSGAAPAGPSAWDGAALRDVPEVPRPARSDATAQALIDAARDILARHGADGISTRKVSKAAGVTTGAMYRRYPGKSSLLADVLLVELGPERYTWSWDLVRALASDDPYRAAATVLAQRMVDAAHDAPAQEVLLQIGVAARSDAALREQVQHRVRTAHEARREMFAHFAQVGILRDDVAPDVLAWGFQALPIGVRVTLPLGIPLDPHVVQSAMAALLTAARP